MSFSPIFGGPEYDVSVCWPFGGAYVVRDDASHNSYSMLLCTKVKSKRAYPGYLSTQVGITHSVKDLAKTKCYKRASVSLMHFE